MVMGTTKEESVDVESRGLKGSRNQCFSVRDGGWQTANGVWSGNLRKKGYCTIADEEGGVVSWNAHRLRVTGFSPQVACARTCACEPTTPIKGES